MISKKLSLRAVQFC